MQITTEYLEQVLKNVESQRAQAQAQLDEYGRGVEQSRSTAQAAAGAAEVLRAVINVSQQGIAGPGGAPVALAPAAANEGGGEAKPEDPFIPPAAESPGDDTVTGTEIS